MDTLTELAIKYGTDKCPQIGHSYTPYYYNLFKDIRDSVKKVLEIGIGFADPRDNTKENGGASLKMWKDFFPNAQIYGADILTNCMMERDRIETFICDQSKREDLEKLIQQTGSDLDIVIDDGSHRQADQRDTCLTLMPLLKKGVIYIIEDVQLARKTIKAVRTLYDCTEVNFMNRRHRDDRILIIKHKNG